MRRKKEIDELITEPKPIKEYRKRLHDAGVLPSDIKAAVEVYSTSLGVPSANLRVSRAVHEVVEQARDVGIDPDPFLSKAAEAAQQAGRKKVGLFGQPGQILEGLRRLASTKEATANYRAQRTQSRTIFERSAAPVAYSSIKR